MATVEPQITRSELREELDRTLRHYATKADLAKLETKLVVTAFMAILATVSLFLAVWRGYENRQ